MEPVHVAKNPNCLTWGCVTVEKNGRIYGGATFWNLNTRRDLVLSFNKTVINRKNREDRYIVRIHYGKNANEFTQRTR